MTTLRLESDDTKLRAFIDDCEFGVITTKPSEVRIERDHSTGRATVWLGVGARKITITHDMADVDGVKVPIDSGGQIETGRLGEPILPIEVNDIRSQ